MECVGAVQELIRDKQNRQCDFTYQLINYFSYNMTLVFGVLLLVAISVMYFIFCHD